MPRQMSRLPDRLRAPKTWQRVRRYLNNQVERDEFVLSVLKGIPKGSRVLDAGAGSQRYRSACAELEYTAQDFGQYKSDVLPSLATGPRESAEPYAYGPIDLASDIWDIPVEDGSFDVVLCTEVLEHIPYPVETIAELSRVLRPRGTLILTAPSNSLRHFDPYFFTSGFSDRWFQTILPRHGFEIQVLDPVGDYYRWMAVELARTGRRQGALASLAIAPSLAYFIARRPTRLSVATMCMGYHVLAIKRGE